MKIKEILKWGFMVLFTSFLVGLTAYPSFAKYDTRNLKNYSRNLDVLADKSGSLHDLINELSNYTVYPMTGSVLGTTMPVAGILPTDTIVGIVVHSSGAMFCGSTVIGNNNLGEGMIAIKSKIWGAPALKISFSFAGSSTNFGLPTQLSSTTGINMISTGTAFEIRINTGAAYTMAIASAQAIVDFINSDPRTSYLVRADTVNLTTSFSTATWAMGGDVAPAARLRSQNLLNGVQNPQIAALVISGSLNISSGPVYSQGDYRIAPSMAVITSSGNVVMSTNAPATAMDTFDLEVIGKRDE